MRSGASATVGQVPLSIGSNVMYRGYNTRMPTLLYHEFRCRHASWHTGGGLRQAGILLAGAEPRPQ